MDYCQNMNLPHLGEDQPGDAYYFSPISIYCFGSCNAVTSHLTVYVYPESEGAKGGNNVSSLLFEYVKNNFVHCCSNERTQCHHGQLCRAEQESNGDSDKRIPC